MDKSNLSKNSIVADSYVLIPCYFSNLNNINFKKDFSKDKEIIKCIDKLRFIIMKLNANIQELKLIFIMIELLIYLISYLIIKKKLNMRLN